MQIFKKDGISFVIMFGLCGMGVIAVGSFIAMKMESKFIFYTCLGGGAAMVIGGFLSAPLEDYFKKSGLPTC